MISFSTGASNVPKNSQPPTPKNMLSSASDNKQLEFDTPDHQHLVIKNNETAISEMSTTQGCNKGDETNLILMDAKDPDLRYGFTKQPEEDTFTYAGTSYALCKTRALPTDFCRNKNGEVGVRGIAEATGDYSLFNKTLNLGYTEKEGKPTITVDLAGFNQPHIQVLLERGLISPQLQLQAKPKGINDLTVVENWQVVPPKADAEKVKWAEEVADKLKPTIADWFQQVHPDLLLKEANKLPAPSLQELGISVETKSIASEI